MQPSSPTPNSVDQSETPEADGMNFRPRFTENEHPFDTLQYELRRSVISNPDGSVVFEMDDVNVPADWSQLATDIVVSKYFRKAGVPGTIHEVSARQVVERIAKAIRASGEKQGGYFRTDTDAEVFENELSYMMIRQMGAFNSPVWFNCGLAESYGIKGNPAGSWAWSHFHKKVMLTFDAYSRPQVSACFIQSISDDLMDIAAGIQREMRLFKFGSGTGSNFSNIRGKGEPLSGGGTSSGLISFLEVFDRAAGAIKSGGTTRRAAKLVCLDMDHPDIEEFIGWKVNEEKKAKALIAAGWSADFNGEAYRTVSGQNANNSVRITDEFMHAVEDGGEWETKRRTDGKTDKIYKAQDLMDMICKAAWDCADPGMQFDTTINKWNTAANSGRIEASNPCSEYMFLSDTACNLASINLTKFYRGDTKEFDIPGFQHACEIFFVAQEILVDHASYPAEVIAERSHKFRTLGLGYANLGALLMRMGVPYDSDKGRDIAGALTAILTGTAYGTSAVMARSKGPFPGYEENKEPCLKVLKMHREKTYSLVDSGVPFLLETAHTCWDNAVTWAEKVGVRNAQATVLAPTGTIGLLMDCDTTGVEPDFALIKFKKLAGGGAFKIINQSVAPALDSLGYTTAQICNIIEYIRGTYTLAGAPCINDGVLKNKGLTDVDLSGVEQALPGAHTLPQAFSIHVLGRGVWKRLGASEEQMDDPEANLLEILGFTSAEISAAGEMILGRHTIEGAPHIQFEHLPVFDCANTCGAAGTRFIRPLGHVYMMAAAQPFLSGAISKTVNMPSSSTVKDIENVYTQAWKTGVKAVAVYRDGSKGCQVLESKVETVDEEGTVIAASAPEPILKRQRLPARRPGGFTHEISIGDQKVYIRTGEYKTGEVGEIFIDMHKEGASTRSLLNSFAIAVSLGLQYGVPLDEFVNAFTFTRFEPSGPMKGHPNIKMATSILDGIFRILGLEYLGRTDFVHVVPDGAEPEVAQPIAPASKTVSDVGPACKTCGHGTVRNGTCFRCHNCGTSAGCS